MKKRILIGAMALLLLTIGALLVIRHQQSLPTETAGTAETDVTNGEETLNGMSPPIDIDRYTNATEAESAEMLRAERAAALAAIDKSVKEYSPELEPQFMAENFPITDENREDLEKMMAALKPIAEKSVEEIISILMSFYPEDERDDETFQMELESYHRFAEIYPALPKEQLAFAVAHDMQTNVAIYRKIAEEVAKWDAKYILPATDADGKVDFHKFLELWIPGREVEIQEMVDQYPDEVKETEALISQSFDPEDRENLRQYLVDRAKEIEDAKQELQDFKEHLDPPMPTMEDALSKYRDMLAAEGVPAEAIQLFEALNTEGGLSKVLSAIASSKADATSVSSDAPDLPAVSSDVPSPTTSSSSSTFDPVKSLTTVQRSLKPWHADIETKYFDVVVSQHLTPKELDKYFPTEQERKILKQRTAQMQKVVVSKVRQAVSNIKGATPAQKRSLARELVTKNFEKDFAKSVLSELEKDAE